MIASRWLEEGDVTGMSIIVNDRVSLVGTFRIFVSGARTSDGEHGARDLVATRMPQRGREG